MRNGQLKDNSIVREQLPSERTIKRWSSTSRNIAIIFTEYPSRSFSLKDLYSLIRTWHLNTPGSKYSEEAVRAVLARFCKKGYLDASGKRGPRSKRYYKATPLGIEVFKYAQTIWENYWSLTKGGLRRVLKADGSLTHSIEVGLRPWREKIAFDSGWKENTRITKIWLDPFIIQQIRTAVGTLPRGNNQAEWLSLRSDNFTLQVSKVKAIQLWVKGPKWRFELRDWLLDVPNLTNAHLDIIWSKIEERTATVTTTREFHVTDPDLSKSRVQLFRGGRPWRRIPKDINEIREISWRDGSRVLRSIERCRQRVRESGRTVRSSSYVSAHLRERTSKYSGTDTTGIREETAGSYAGFQEVAATSAGGGV